MDEPELIPRDKYLKKIRPHIDKPVVKVLTGIRRCGKSAILLLIEQDLIARGVSKNHIIKINFEESRFSELTDAKKLNDYIDSKISDGSKYYLLLDEIQEVASWEKVINSNLASGKTDIYITGSNSRLLSSELSTYLAGRYVEIPIQTLTFGEYLEFVKYIKGEDTENIRTAFSKYMRLGGFPLIHIAEYDEDSADIVVNGIYSSVVLRDVIQRYEIRNTDLLERLILFLFDNVGNIFSAKSISDFLKSENRKITVNTIYSYLKIFEEAFVVRKVSRYDMSGKKILKTLEKYYVSDVGLVYSVLGFKDTKISGLLENIIYLELISRDYKVAVGKLGTKEIDFVAEKRGDRIYVQVTRAIESDETREREFSPLLSVKDQYHKYVVMMSDGAGSNVDGVKLVHAADFLLMSEY